MNDYILQQHLIDWIELCKEKEKSLDHALSLYFLSDFLSLDLYEADVNKLLDEFQNNSNCQNAFAKEWANSISLQKEDLELPVYLKDWVLSCYNNYKLFKEIFYSSKYQLFVYENFYPFVTVEQATIAMNDDDIQTLIAKEWVHLERVKSERNRKSC